MKPFNQIKHSNQTLIRIIKRKKPILKLSKHLLKKVGFFMYKRCVILFGFFMLLFCMAFFSIDYLSDKETLYDAALNQQNYNLKIANIRGTIYDCRNIPLVNTEKKFIAAAVPCTESLTALTPVVSDDKKEELYKKCSKNTPFTIEVNSRVNSPYVKVFEVPIRYSGITPAAHIIGYISGDKKGLCGIEKIYDEYLSGNNHDIYIKYCVDASGKILPGKKEFIEDKSYLKSKGVVLNIDSRIQAIVEEAANKYITRGAVIVSEVPECEIRACSSLPGFLPGNVAPYLNDKNSPLLNRIMCSFNLGSVFKIVTSAAALEGGISENTLYDCRGFNKVEDACFKCFNSKKHETVNMEQALAHSCNGYFIELIKKMPYNALLNMARKFKLGESVSLAPGMNSDKGTLPSEESLKNIKTLANFSFGQGKLMATPLQVTGIINTIASGGIYSNPKLIKGLTDESMKITKKDIISPKRERIISESTAKKLKSHMKASIDYGTSERGKPEKTDAAAKTSTAQTGIIEDGKKIEQSWFAGFFPYENPKYSIVILSEAGSGGGESCGPVFKEITDRIISEIPELFIDKS